MLRDLGAEAREVRTPADLLGPPTLDGLIIPGGESTTMTLGIAREGLAEPLRELAQSGTPVLGTCAGMIMLDRDHLGVADWVCKRNAWGRQIFSFEEDLELPGVDGRLRAVFIRAPRLDAPDPAVDVLAEVDGHPVAIRKDNILAVAFHPELTDDARVHAWLVDQVRQRADDKEHA
ncbi:MAG: pyridoxal 5-phosphate synthase pdxT subunit [Solirubrobacteraceae bacterium]|nr:pyridoxal 5-phosphate synthase pdxT subunit [Solirubrobacteraceae bacterium]